jgi:hypothetical protein
MADAHERITSVSLSKVRVLALNEYGVPAATDTTEYAGIQWEGVLAMSLNLPERRRISNPGDDGILAHFDLPAQEGASGELRHGGLDMLGESLVSGVEIEEIGESRWLHNGTRVQRLPQVCLIGSRPAKSYGSDEAGRLHNQHYVVHRATIDPMGGEAADGASEERMSGVTIDVVTRLVFGRTLSDVVDGVTHADVSMVSTEHDLRIAAFLGDVATVAFGLTVDAVDVDKITVYTFNPETGASVDVTAALDSLTVDTITFAAAPEDLYVIAVYEVEA